MFLTPKELSERWHNTIKPSTLAVWRSKHKGPGYTTIGDKILYSIEEIEKYEKENHKEA